MKTTELVLYFFFSGQFAWQRANSNGQTEMICGFDFIFVTLYIILHNTLMLIENLLYIYKILFIYNIQSVP